MMEPKLLPLDDWARATYGDRAPGIGTLRRWARDAMISPRPEKHGRTYMVVPEAKYAPQSRRPRLVDRIKANVSASKKRA